MTALGVEEENIESRNRYAAARTTPSASIATSEEDATAISGRYLEEIIVVERTKPGEEEQEEQEWSLDKS